MNESIPERCSPEDERLDTLFRAYYSACEPGQVSPNFMPELWQKIERVQNATFSFRRIAQSFVTAAAALSLVLAVVAFVPSHQNSALYNATYVDFLTAHNEALAAHNDSSDYMDLLHPDSPDDVEEI
jgi:hypothetical protein